MRVILFINVNFSVFIKFVCSYALMQMHVSVFLFPFGVCVCSYMFVLVVCFLPCLFLWLYAQMYV